MPVALLALLTVLRLTLLAGAPAWAQAPKAGRPSYTVGDKWIRSDGAYDLIRIENGRYVFAADGGREVHLTRDLGIARIVRGGQVVLELDPPASPTWGSSPSARPTQSARADPASASSAIQTTTGSS